MVVVVVVALNLCVCVSIAQRQAKSESNSFAVASDARKSRTVECLLTTKTDSVHINIAELNIVQNNSGRLKMKPGICLSPLPRSITCLSHNFGPARYFTLLIECMWATTKNVYSGECIRIIQFTVLFGIETLAAYPCISGTHSNRRIILTSKKAFRPLSPERRCDGLDSGQHTVRWLEWNFAC